MLLHADNECVVIQTPERRVVFYLGTKRGRLVSERVQLALAAGCMHWPIDAWEERWEEACA